MPHATPTRLRYPSVVCEDKEDKASGNGVQYCSTVVAESENGTDGAINVPPCAGPLREPIAADNELRTQKLNGCDVTTAKACLDRVSWDRKPYQGANLKYSIQ